MASFLLEREVELILQSFEVWSANVPRMMTSTTVAICVIGS